MGLGSLACTEQLKAGLGEAELAIGEEAEEDWADVVGGPLAIPTRPLTRLKRGSGHNGVLPPPLDAGSKEKRPV